MSEQNFENHASMVPAYHYLAATLVFVPLLWFGYRAVTAFSVDALMLLLLTLGVVLVGFFARSFALGVQDRVIRGEERARLERVLTPELAGRIDEFTTDQLIGLRFASDGELLGLAAKVLRGELVSRKAIKGAVGSWRADHERI